MATFDPKKIFSKRLGNMGGSAIRDLLKQAGQPGFISLGGGYPDPKSFPAPLFETLNNRVHEKYGEGIYQYGKTEGFDPLLQILPQFFQRLNRKVKATPDTIAITTGSQQALTMLGMLFIDAGDLVAVESPTYLGALQAFNPFNPTYIEMETDEGGIIPQKLDELLTKHPSIKFIYTVSTFQNPTGKTISLERRKQIVSLLLKHNTLAVEDDPYSELRYDGVPVASLQSLAPEHVVHLFTFSKTFAPDFRLGGLVAPSTIRDAAVMIKQGLDLCSSNHDQAMVAEYLLGNYLDPHIDEIVKLYKPRRDCMISAIEKYFPPIFQHTSPEGGMFIWVSLKEESRKYDEKLDIKKVLTEVISQKVGFVPGSAFYARKTGAPFSMRLNFTNQTEENIERGVRIVGSVLKRHLK